MAVHMFPSVATPADQLRALQSQVADLKERLASIEAILDPPAQPKVKAKR